jgi:MarR family transcriptional regulator, 2-MHQ and catechol-resistance regulon repressor
MKCDLELWVVLARAYEAVRRHAVADIARHELTPGEFGVLEALYHGEPLLLGELQQKVLVSSGGVTFLVERRRAADLLRTLGLAAAARPLPGTSLPKEQ